MDNPKTLNRQSEKQPGTDQEPTLGVIMIVKDEESRLGNILSDIKDLVDEIVVVDTGSSDRTVSIAMEHGAKIGHFTWCNDFSAARNASIALANSDYLLWLDADDRLDPDQAGKLKDLKRHLRPARDRAYLLKVLNTTREDGDRICVQLRIFPNREELGFKNRIHEQIAPSIERAGILMESTDILVRHTGYHEKTDIRDKYRRNLSILLEDLSAGNISSSQHFFIASTYFGLGEFERCLEHITAARTLGDSLSWLQNSYTLASECFLHLDRIEDALAELEQGVADFPDRGIMHYLLGSAYLRADNIEAAITSVEKAMLLGIQAESFSIPSQIHEGLPYTYGTALEKAGRLDEAAAAYKASLSVNPKGLPAIMALGNVLIKTGKIDEALLHLTKARDMTEAVNIPLWLSLAKIHHYRKNHAKARALYLEILNETPSDLGCLAGLISTSVDLDDIETFLSALEQLLLTLGIPVPETTLDSLAECAGLCLKGAYRLKDLGEPALARLLAETSLRLDSTCSNAYLFLADLFSDQGDTAHMIAILESALKNGIDRQKVLLRINSINLPDINSRS
ncbi:MAG TPA: tetratricopeptide repeat protein [Deltaproteobacteria bacterium]|nr:tetratricopeptide repeat protein [Deltaproteobacteria bacterium]